MFNFNQTKFFYSLGIFIAIAVLAISVFPINQGEIDVYNYNTQKNEKIGKENYTAILIIGITALGLLAWMANTEIPTETTLLRTPNEILQDPKSASMLGNFSVNVPATTKHFQILGDSDLGYIGIMRVVNCNWNDIYFTYIANENYQYTNTRPRSTCPLIQGSEDPYELKSAIETLPPKQRASAERKFAAFLQRIKKDESGASKALIDKASEIASQEEIDNSTTE